MDQKSQNDKKRHHYIPITYLDKFADDTGKGMAYRKDEVLKPLHLRPSAIAFERYYYSQPLPEGGRDNNTLEDFFSTIESTWPPLVDRLRSGSAAGSDLDALEKFMSLMRVRVPAVRDMVETSRAERVKAGFRVLDQAGQLPPKPKGHEDILDDISVSIDPHQSLLAMPTLERGFGLILDRLEFEVVHNETDVSFLTSDNPVVYFDPTVREEMVLPYQVRRTLDSIELLFPIDPDTVLRGRTGPHALRHVTLTDRQSAKRINRFVARFGYRFVFSRDHTHEALIIKHAGTSPILKSTVVPSPTGGSYLHFESVFGVPPIKPKWSTDRSPAPVSAD
jgi:Protein of unknown function (DUF4238)